MLVAVWNECSISKKWTALTDVLQSTSPGAICSSSIMLVMLKVRVFCAFVC